MDFKYSSSPEADLVVRSSPERVSHAGKMRSISATIIPERSSTTPTYKSCTKFLATIASEKFGFDAKPIAELIHWGDIIDGAQFDSPEAAVRLTDPATQLALVIEAAPDPDLVPKLIPDMAYKSLGEMIQLPIVQKYLAPLLERHRKSVDIFRERADFRERCDLFRRERSGSRGLQQVRPLLSCSRMRCFPWVSALRRRAPRFRLAPIRGKRPPKDVNLASLCEKYGGGGHARVAAISLGPGDLVRARQIAKEIAATLRQHA